MKTIALIFISQIVFATIPENNGAKTAGDLAERILIAFQHESVEDFKRLSPSIDELTKLMDTQRELYGPWLSDAKADLADHYNNQFIHMVNNNFYKVIEEGKGAGIVWRDVKISHVEYGEATTDIVFKYKNEEFRLQVGKMLFINGEWKATQSIRLI